LLPHFDLCFIFYSGRVSRNKRLTPPPFLQILTPIEYSRPITVNDRSLISPRGVPGLAVTSIRCSIFRLVMVSGPFFLFRTPASRFHQPFRPRFTSELSPSSSTFLALLLRSMYGVVNRGYTSPLLHLAPLLFFLRSGASLPLCVAFPLSSPSVPEGRIVRPPSPAEVVHRFFGCD